MSSFREYHLLSLLWNIWIEGHLPLIGPQIFSSDHCSTHALKHQYHIIYNRKNWGIISKKFVGWWDSLCCHLCKLKRTKSLIQTPVVHQQKLAPMMMNIDHYLALLVSVLKKALQQFKRHTATCYTNTFHFVDEPFMPLFNQRL